MNIRYQAFLLVQVFCLLLCISCARSPKTSTVHEDGFFRRAPETVGVRSDAIIRFIEEAEAQQMELHSVMILRHNYVIAEGWWYPYKRNDNHIMHSISKIYTSTAVGFAVTEGLLSTEDKVISFFPDDLPAEIPPGLDDMTVRHLLTMSAGHDEAPAFYRTDDNWVKAFLATPVDHEPGSKFVYSSYATYMLSAILQKVTGKSIVDYLTPRLFEPLGINNIQWETDTRGINCGGWGLRVKTSDMAKLGQLYLRKGKWQDKQLLPASWIAEASSPQIYQRPDRTDEENANDDWAQGYGFQIWTCTHDAYRGDGANGQFIIVMPEQDMVVIMTGNIGNMQAQLRLVWDYLLPGVMEKPLLIDEHDVDMLTSKLSSLSLPDLFRTPDETDFPALETRSYTMEQNELNISKVSFSSDDNGKNIMSYTQDGKVYDFAFGLDTWEFGMTEKTGPYFLNQRRSPLGLAPFSVAGYSSRMSETQLNLRLLYLTESQEEIYICRFDGDKLAIQVSNSAEPRKEPAVLNGTKE